MARISLSLLSRVIMIALIFSTVVVAQPANSAALQEAAKLHAQVVQLYKENKLDEALPLAKRVVEIREKELSDGDHLLAVSYTNLAHIYRTKKKYDEAEKYFRRALKVEEKRLGKDHPELYDLLIEIAWVCHGQAKTSEAETLFKQAIANKEKQRGPDHKEVAEALYNLAIFYQKNGNPEKSLSIYERMLTIREKSFSEISQEFKETAEQCACALQQSKKNPESFQMWKRARFIEAQLHPEYEHPTGGVLQGRATKKVQPEYPAAAKNARLDGVVLVKVLINENGRVVEAKSLCGADLLAPASEAAASKWEFTTTELNGKPVKVQGILTFNFTLR